MTKLTLRWDGYRFDLINSKTRSYSIIKNPELDVDYMFYKIRGPFNMTTYVVNFENDNEETHNWVNFDKTYDKTIPNKIPENEFIKI